MHAFQRFFWFSQCADTCLSYNVAAARSTKGRMTEGETNEKTISYSEDPCPILGVRRDWGVEPQKGGCLCYLGGCRAWTPVPSLPGFLGLMLRLAHCSHYLAPSLSASPPVTTRACMEGTKLLFSLPSPKFLGYEQLMGERW